MNVIHVFFAPEFRDHIAAHIKTAGVQAVDREMRDLGYHPSFITVFIRSIMRKEGW